jgi:VCBS repeat-containing protein
LADPSGQTTITITGISQDEPVGNNGPDGKIIDNNTVQLRAEREGGGNGRVYHIFFSADDGQGFSCTGSLPIAVVEHDQSGNPISTPIDDGPLFDATETGKFAPEAVDDTATTDEDHAVAGTNVLANDIRAKQNDTLSVSAVNGNSGAVGQQITLPSGALLTLNASGSYTYNPNGHFELPAGATATDAFEYTVKDQDGDTDIGLVTITITGLNDVPVAVNDAATTDKDSVLVVGAQSDKRVLANDTDADGDPLSVSAVNGNAAGVGQQLTLASGALLTLNAAGTYTYNPNGKFNSLPAGQQASDTFTYTVSDGHGGIATATVTITITSANQPPVANNDTASVNEDDPSGVTINVVANDTDVDGNLLAASVTVVSSVVNGTLVNNGDGSLKYTPNANFSGQDSFTYRVSDGGGLTSNTATVSISVTPVPDAPVANDDQASLNTNETSVVVINVIANDTDADGDLNPASVTVTSNPAQGTAVGNGDGTITYTATGGGLGTDTFTYQVCDTAGACATATVTVTVSGNRPPDAVDDPNITTPQGKAVVINVLANDTDPDGDTLTVSQFSQGSRGTVTANPDGSLTYTPSSNFKGSDTFTYTISDGKGGTDTATVTITTTK